jgi:hypothetical protein
MKALGNAQGIDVKTRSSPERAKQKLMKQQAFLTPNILFVKCNFMPLEQPSQFTLECHLSMILLLILDIPSYRCNIGLAYRKCCIASLPIEIVNARPVVLDQFRASFLDFLNDLFERVILREQEERMDMVLNTSDDKGRACPLFEDPGLIRK